MCRPPPSMFPQSPSCWGGLELPRTREGYFAYVNEIGAQEGVVFEGGSYVANSNGEVEKNRPPTAPMPLKRSSRSMWILPASFGPGWTCRSSGTYAPRSCRRWPTLRPIYTFPREHATDRPGITGRPARRWMMAFDMSTLQPEEKELFDVLAESGITPLEHAKKAMVSSRSIANWWLP